MDRLRNKLAKFLCDWVLLNIATADYRHKIDMLIQQGQFHAQFSGPYLVYKPDEEQD